VALDGKDWHKFKKKTEIWKVRATSRGKSVDLKKAMMSLSIATYPFWFRSTDGLVKTDVMMDDPVAKYLRELQIRENSDDK
jgi:hypothetical protein